MLNGLTIKKINEIIHYFKCEMLYLHQGRSRYRIKVYYLIKKTLRLPPAIFLVHNDHYYVKTDL